MARVTVENCMDKMDNRFELVTVASYRAKEINKGSKILVEKDNDKNAVIALREIEKEKIDPILLKEKFLQTLRKDYNPDILDEEKNETSADVKEEIEQFTDPESNPIVVESYVFEDEEEADD